MRKRFVGLLAFALVLTCAAAAMAFQAPINHPDWTAGASSGDMIFGQRIDIGDGANVSDNITISLFTRRTERVGIVLSGDSADTPAVTGLTPLVRPVHWDSRFVRLSPDQSASTAANPMAGISVYPSIDVVLFRAGQNYKQARFAGMYAVSGDHTGITGSWGNPVMFTGGSNSKDVLLRLTGTNWQLYSRDTLSVTTVNPVQFWAPARTSLTVSIDATHAATNFPYKAHYGDSGDFKIEWACPACGTLNCGLLVDKGLLYFDLSSDVGVSRDLNGTALTLAGVDSLDLIVYGMGVADCGTYQKQWQVIPNDHFVHYLDMVCYSTNVGANLTHSINYGPYVIDRETQNDTAGAGVYANWLIATRPDWVAERIWNKSALFADALQYVTGSENHFGWQVIGELAWFNMQNAAGTAGSFAPAWDAQGGPARRDTYKCRSVYQPNNAADGVGQANRIAANNMFTLPFSYLATQDAQTTRPASEAASDRWYRYLMPYAQSADLNPGFSTYYGYNAREVNGHTPISRDFNYTTANVGGVRMDFDATGTAADFCERSYMVAKLWSYVQHCFQAPIGQTQWNRWDNATCINVTPKSIDQDMKRDVFAALVSDGAMANTDFAKLAPYYVDPVYPDVCECGAVEALLLDVANTFVPSGSSLCLKASFDVYNKTACVQNKNFFLPAKITFFVSQAQICNVDVASSITTAVSAIDGTTLHKGPIDAFMMSNDVAGDYRVTFGILYPDSTAGTTGTWYNLGYLANDYFTSSDKASRPWVGVKNFFRVWPTEANEDGQPGGAAFPIVNNGEGFGAGNTVRENRHKTVRQSWLDNDKLAFSFYVVFVPMNPPTGKDPVQAKDGYFLVYTGAWNKVGETGIDPTRIMSEFGMFTNFTAKSAQSVAPTPTVGPTVAPTSGPTPTSAPTTPTVAPTSGPTTTPTPGSGGSSGGGCNVGFAPAVLLLLAPMALFLRK